MLWLQHDILNRHHDMPNFHRDELFLQHDLNGRNTIFFVMHKTALACHTYMYTAIVPMLLYVTVSHASKMLCRISPGVLATDVGFYLKNDCFPLTG